MSKWHPQILRVKKNEIFLSTPTVEGLKKLCELEPGFKAGGYVMVLKCNIWHSYKRELEKTNEEMVEIGRSQKNTK